MVTRNTDNRNGTAPSTDDIYADLLGLMEDLLTEKDRKETQLVPALPSHIRTRVADIKVRVGLLGKHPGDAKRAEVAKKLLDFVLLLGQFSTDHAKLGVMLHELFLHALQTMHGMDAALPLELQVIGKANSRKLLGILDAAQEEAMTAYGERSMVYIMQALEGR